ncbi:hypothetical protein WR25_25123 [Diploscapter pachys]|uniref:Ubiquitin-like modifier-activating enzyme ATG7 n=1 Tax=Diploscapter pachys TaxID=2018661 RepID=A0A2A2LC27_9BILA|nr:hypothetical protein WR25_25123 [Diploscapter pachys]
MEPPSFVPFETLADTTFWKRLMELKLNEWKLDEQPRRIRASVGIYDSIGDRCRAAFSHDSFDLSDVPSFYSGLITVYNTIESFNEMAHRKAILNDSAAQIWSSCLNRTWLQNPSSLFSFHLTVFADLKKFVFYYFNCFTALVYPSNLMQKISPYTEDVSPLLEYSSKNNCPLFLLRGTSLESIEKLTECESSSDCILVICDPSPVDASVGWPFRNVLCAIATLHQQWTSVRILSLRASASSRLVEFTWTPTPIGKTPSAVGWERDFQNELRPRVVKLKDHLDPTRLMDQAVDLNVSLIKWRLVPDMKIQRFKQTKFLIFGAGTLGCNIARCLLGYGVRQITFIDNGFVSYSNPVRQSLSEFSDAQNGRKKAEVAADALKRIFPSVQAEWHHLTVPMPGHTIDEKDTPQLEQTVQQLEDLISSHDVLFLALDSREARWLPTLLANRHSKASVALGFDNYVVIRHGIRKKESSSEESPSSSSSPTSLHIPYSDLACYFCSDVTAPGNSTADRTLDQQCTVSRPGLSMIASGTAVELVASVLQAESPSEAAACIGEQDDSSSLFGATPHQIRGFIFKFQQLTPCVRQFSKCVACGDSVLTAYENDRIGFLKQVLNNPLVLESVSGLNELQNSAQNVNIDFEDSDSVASSL